MSVPRYSKYKQSGVVWLGDVPEHWDVKPFFAVAKERDEPNTGMIEDNLLSLSYGRIIQKNIDDNDGLLPASFETYQIVHAGDIVFRLTDLQNDQRSLRTAIVREKGIITSAYLAAIPTKINPEFFNYLLRAYDKMKIFYSMGGGLRQSMKFSDIKWLPILTPPEEAQKSIAAFLDRETAKIDALVTEQERLIDLLKEKRQAVISHAVTKGLNPKAPMKPSGIDWLGDIPAHWEVKKISHRFNAKKGGNAAQLTKEYCATIEGEYPVYSGQTENNGVMATINAFEFDAGDDGYLFSTTVGAKAMSLMHLKGKFSLSQNCMVIIPTESDVFARYAYYHFQPLFSYERSMIPEHMQASFRMEDLYQYRFTMPPFDEQTSIASYLDAATEKFENLMLEAQKAIELLQERRTALISAAVTGKIDVRGIVSDQNKEAA